jgi:sn-glycerol 3-phosphate transport system ATP-binding protein
MTLAQRMMVMNAGRMEQFGTPEEVYNLPASTFVASFMGSPPMNLLRRGPNADFGGKPGAIMGIRPEHLQITGSGWQVQVETVEMLGAERLVYCRLGDEPLIVRTDESDACPALGASIHVTPRPERMHWFDAASGIRL